MDLVPCFYTGQDQRREVAIPFLRSEVHEFRRQKLGEFIQHGRAFLFYQRVVKRILEICDGPISAKSILHFLKTRTDGEKLHYEIPMAGDRSIFARHHRKLVRPSRRVPDEVAIAQMVAAYDWRKRLRPVTA